MEHAGPGKRVSRLFSRFNEPTIPRERIEHWLEQFPENDREAALLLLESIEFHTYPRLLRECRQLHAMLITKLREDGFDGSSLTDVDFSREFTCKSGDIISYLYRKANGIPSVDFKNFDHLISESSQASCRFGDRALVILDDYIGTGSQFIFQFVARSEDDIRVITSYRKVYLVSIVAHDNVFEKLDLLQGNECRKVLSIEEAQFPDVDWTYEENKILDGLMRVDWGKITCLCAEREHALLSAAGEGLPGKRERDLIGKFLARYGGDSALATGYLAGHHAFFYGAPNSIPKVLLPLFSRVEDYSIYPMEYFRTPTPVVIRYDMDETGRQGT